MLEFQTGDADLHTHAPLHAVIRFGKKAEERFIPVKLGARLTEIGTLETWCESKIGDNRWRLQFELRKQAAVEQPADRKAAAVVSEPALKASLELVSTVFSPTAKSPIAPEEVPARLEQTMGLGKNSWPLSAIRQLADAFLAAADGRKKSPAYEIRWLNLCGFCLRPGFGYPGDDFRIEQTRRIYSAGLTHGNQVQCEVEWWIFWGRLAGGLNRNQQTDVYQRLSGFLLPRGAKKPPRINAALLREMWRTVSSLELLPVGAKTELAETLLKRVKLGDFKESELWCLSRLAARKLFYGPTNLVIPPAAVARWVEALLNIPSCRRRPSRHGPPHRRPHARSPHSHARGSQAQATDLAPRRAAGGRRWKAKKTTARWAASSARNCRRGWCWKRLRRLGNAAGVAPAVNFSADGLRPVR